MKLICLGIVSIIFTLSCKTTSEKPVVEKVSSKPAASLQLLSTKETPLTAKPPAKPDPNIAKYMRDKVSYMGGFLGQVGTKKIFYASIAVVPDYDKLYWVMVSVLSKKYGCFMESRYETNNKMLFKCRDGRLVDFNRRITDQWALFGARQYDAAGREIIVKNRKVVRNGDARVVIPDDLLENP